MTKMSQCGKCRIGNGAHCMHYKPTDDSDCAYYEYGEANEDVGGYGSNLLRIWWKVAIVVIVVCLMFIHDKIIAAIVAGSILFLALIGVMVYIWKK